MTTENEREGYFRDRNKKLESMTEGRANERQIGGTHYRSKNITMQHWDLMAVNNAGYFVGQVTKYVARWREKNGYQDVQKSEHYLQKLIELTSEGVLEFPPKREAILLPEYHKMQHLHSSEYRIFEIMLTYTTLGELQEALEAVGMLCAEGEQRSLDDLTKRIPL